MSVTGVELPWFQHYDFLLTYARDFGYYLTRYCCCLLQEYVVKHKQVFSDDIILVLGLPAPSGRQSLALIRMRTLIE